MRSRVLCIIGVLAACGGGEQRAGSDTTAQGGPQVAAATAEEMAAARGGGSITGSVDFSGSPPTNPAIDMAEEPECRSKHAAAPFDPQIMVANGKLANVFVYVKSGLPADRKFAAPTTPVVLDQDGCIYQPRVFGAMVGQKVEIRNSDPVLHNIKAVPKQNRVFNISQPTKGMVTTRTFTTREVMVPLECNVHGWMNAYVGVLDHPYFATSGADGSFSITGLPAGTYEVEAWHEVFGTRTATVTVPENGSAATTFTFAKTTT